MPAARGRQSSRCQGGQGVAGWWWGLGGWRGGFRRRAAAPWLGGRVLVVPGLPLQRIAGVVGLLLSDDPRKRPEAARRRPVAALRLSGGIKLREADFGKRKTQSMAEAAGVGNFSTSKRLRRLWFDSDQSSSCLTPCMVPVRLIR